MLKPAIDDNSFPENFGAWMNTYLIRRLLTGIVTLFGVSIVIFLIMHLVPGDFAEMFYGVTVGRDPALLAQMNARYGLDKPLPVQYLVWLKQVIRGDLGFSLRSHQPILEEIQRRAGITAELTFMGTFMSLIIGIPLGIIAAIKRKSSIGFFARLFALAGLSIPDFVLGTCLILFISITYLPLPIAGYVSPEVDLTKHLSSLLLPALTLGTITSAIVARMTRASMLEVISEQYVLTAISKGLKQRHIIIRHIFKNSLIPVVTVVGINVGYLLGGTVIVEEIYSLPGLGRYTLQGILNRDHPVVQGTVLLAGVIFVAINILVDILYGYLDPRVRDHAPE